MQPEAEFLGREGVPIAVAPGDSPVDHTCGSVVFSQIPRQINLFVGRAHDYAPPGSPTKCAPHRPPWSTGWLALFRMDWEAHTLSYVRDVLRPPVRFVTPAGRVVEIRSAGDPSVAYYNGEFWVAFECGGTLHGNSVCIAPLNPRTYAVDDPSRMTLVVEGGPAETGYSYSASAPNMVVFRNRAYIYWAALQVDMQARRWVGDAIRGMALVQENSGLRRVWGAGSAGSPTPSYYPSLNVEVVGIDPSDPMSDQSVDLKGAYADNSYVYILAGSGGRGPGGKLNCVSGGGGSYGCFRLQIFRSSNPLGTHVFNQSALISPRLPFNPTGYDRFFIDNHGQLSILGYFFPPHGNYHVPNLVPPGLRSFPVDLSTLRF